MLAIGPSLINLSGEDSIGLFTTVNVVKDTILCIKKGILLNVEFWSFVDYNKKDIRVITMTNDKRTNQPITSILDKDNSISYSDFLIDPLDHKLVNTEFVELENDGIIVLKCTKSVMAYSQLFVSLGKEFMMAKILSYEWSLANSTINVNLPFVKKAMHVYLITKNDILKNIKLITGQ